MQRPFVVVDLNLSVTTEVRLPGYDWGFPYLTTVVTFLPLKRGFSTPLKSYMLHRVPTSVMDRGESLLCLGPRPSLSKRSERCSRKDTPIGLNSKGVFLQGPPGLWSSPIYRYWSIRKILGLWIQNLTIKIRRHQERGWGKKHLLNERASSYREFESQVVLVDLLYDFVSKNLRWGSQGLSHLGPYSDLLNMKYLQYSTTPKSTRSLV